MGKRLPLLERRLTEEERAKAANPEFLTIATEEAGRAARFDRRRYEDFLSAAYCGIVEAVHDYDPKRSKMDQGLFVRYRCRFAIYDAMRTERPLGYRNWIYRHEKQPTTSGNANVACDGVIDDSIELLPSEDLPIGWELESMDEVEKIPNKLEGHKKVVAKLLFAHGLTVTEIARRFRSSLNCASYHLAESLRVLRELAGVISESRSIRSMLCVRGHEQNKQNTYYYKVKTKKGQSSYCRLCRQEDKRTHKLRTMQEVCKERSP